MKNERKTAGKPTLEIFPANDRATEAILKNLHTTKREIKTWHDIDIAMQEFDFLKTHISALNSTELKEYQAIIEKRREPLTQLNEAKQMIVTKIETFCAKHKAEMKFAVVDGENVGSRSLPHGTVTFVQVTKVRFKPAQANGDAVQQ